MADQALCSIPDCGKPQVNFRGWCNAHYRRWRRHGDPLRGRAGNYGNQTCCVENCEKPARIKSMCPFHYQRHMDGTELTKPKTDAKAAVRFLNDTIANPPSSGCVFWPYSRYGNGYGRVEVDGRTLMPHRVVCLRVHGEPPSLAHEVAHNCGNPACVSPHHVRWATHVENCADRIGHGTSNRGERHGNSKLTREIVLEVRHQLSLGANIADLAGAYKVLPSTIRRVANGKRWGWLK